MCAPGYIRCYATNECICKIHVHVHVRILVLTLRCPAVVQYYRVCTHVCVCTYMCLIYCGCHPTYMYNVVRVCTCTYIVPFNPFPHLCASLCFTHTCSLRMYVCELYKDLTTCHKSMQWMRIRLALPVTMDTVTVTQTTSVVVIMALQELMDHVKVRT